MPEGIDVDYAPTAEARHVEAAQAFIAYRTTSASRAVIKAKGTDRG
jgi:hypothetical protein